MTHKRTNSQGQHLHDTDPELIARLNELLAQSATITVTTDDDEPVTLTGVWALKWQRYQRDWRAAEKTA